MESGNFQAIGGGGHGKGGNSAIDPDKPSTAAYRRRAVTALCMELRCFYIEADQRSPCRATAANRSLARGARIGEFSNGRRCSRGRRSRRSRLVSSCTRTAPIVGSTIVLAWPSPIRIRHLPLGLILLRMRKLSRQRPFRFGLGKPLRCPWSVPPFPFAYAASACPRSTAASSNTCAETSRLHVSPTARSVTMPS